MVVMLAPTTTLDPADFVAVIACLLDMKAADAEPDDLPMKEAVQAFRKRYIARALANAGGNQRVAAEQLGLQRTFLNRLIKEYGL